MEKDEQREPEFLSPEEFARRTGLAVHTVRTMVRARRLAATKTAPGKGGTWLIPTSEIARLHEEAQAWRVEEPPSPDDIEFGEDENPA